jgi:SAM-dependent methyltransferase
MRGFQALFLAQRDVAYTSFDLERYAMERGDLTAMQYPSDSADYFTCFHVLEHVPNEAKALSEIRRVLKPGGTAIFQVPIDATVEHTYEYEKPDPREVGHVRRYARDFAARLRRHGFDVEAVSATDCCDDDDIRRYGLSRDPIYLATKPVSAIDCPVAAADSCSEVAELTARRV